MNSSVAIDINPRGAPQNNRSEHPVEHAWVAIGAFVFMTIAGMSGATKFMNYLFPASSFLLSLFLYHRHPIFFQSFAWWLVFLSPLVRRIVDYKSSFTDPSPILLAPLLTMIVILPSFIKCFPKAHIYGTVPFAISASAVAYGLVMGCLNHVPVNKLILGSIGWIYPILYGFFVVINWRRYPEYQKNFEQVLIWGILLMGLYGIYQYFFLPEWDRLWIINSNFNAAGTPSPRDIRVWSTLNSGEPFAAFMAAGLILTLDSRGFVFKGSILAGYITFLLTLVRSAWLGWVSGIFILFAASKPRFQMKLISWTVILTGLILPISIATSFLEVIQAKFNTLSNLEDDVSANARQSAYADIDSALGNFLGDGISQINMDSSIFSLLGELGWIGGIPYLLGLFGLFFTCWKISIKSTNNFSRLTLAAAVTCIVRIPLNSTFVGVSGLVLWGSLAFCIAGAKYDLSRSKINII
jgi:ABC-type amino acid transport system permease subunit